MAAASAAAALPIQLIVILIFLFLSPISLAKDSNIHPNALVLPISKHATTLQYTTQIHQRTPLVPINIVLDLSGQFLWISYNDSNYNSSSYTPTTCHSPQCSTARYISNHNNKIPTTTTTTCNSQEASCNIKLSNIFSGKTSSGKLSKDLLSISSTDGLNPRSNVSTQFIFSSAPVNFSRGLAPGSQGIAGLGQTLFALPKQLSDNFNISKKFAICLPPSTKSTGVIFFGDKVPYAMFPGIDVSKLLTYTPLIKYLDEYYLGKITSIQVNSKIVPINPSTLTYNKKSRSGGIKISTRNPYTVMKSSIYKAFTEVFIQEAKNVTRMRKGIAPFEVCFSRKVRDDGGVAYMPAMPSIDLVLQAEEVFWRIFETNSMVQIGGNVICLGFLDGGVEMKEGIVIGGHQLEDNMLEFDLEQSRLGFTSTLLFRETSCSNFNFTPKSS